MQKKKISTILFIDPLETILKLLTVKKNQVYTTSLLISTNNIQLILGKVLDMYIDIWKMHSNALI